MEFKILNYFLKYFFFILLFQNQNINSIKLNEKYPVSYLLSNKDLFLVTENGFRLYDSTLKTLKNHYDFTSDERKISNVIQAELTSIAQFSDGIIIALVNKYLYILDQNCNYIKEQDLNSILVNGIYYNLIAYKVQSPLHYYIISYYDSSGSTGPFSIKYWNFATDSTVTSTDTLIEKTYCPKKSTGEDNLLEKSGLSCQIMNKDAQDVLTCFYQINDVPAIGVTSFEISESSINEINMVEALSSNDRASAIKSALSSDKKVALICYTKYNEYGRCLQYNIDSNTFSSQTQFFSQVKYGSIGMNVYYFQEKNEYMFICSNNGKGLNVVLFNSNFEATIPNSEGNTEPYYEFGGKCYNLFTFNVIYLSDVNDYILINDCEGDGSTFSSGSINLERLADETNEFPIEEDIDLNYDPPPRTNRATQGNGNIPNNADTNEIQKSNNNTIIKDTSSKTKEELINDFDELIKDKEPEQSYVINGDDYTVIIKPVNSYVEESTVNIDFTECEKVLKEKYPNKQFRILQINMENKNENCLTDQVEYKIYDEVGNEMDLSICDNVEILIEYEIKNTSLLNLEQISNFQSQGIDIFNLNHDFFNDICYSYSDNGSNSDMILSDRVADIYQNFSICGEGCEYESFNTEKLSANCNCKVKQEVSTEEESGNFKTYIVGAFLDSNFGVVKCFNLVFSFKGKAKNDGFWILGIMGICHIPLYVLYCINGTTPVSNYINKEMDKKGYKEKERKESKKKSITPRMESTRQNIENKDSSPSLKLRKNRKKSNENNPPKKHDLSSSFDKKQNNNKKQVNENIHIRSKAHRKSRTLSDKEDNDKHRKHNSKKKSSKRLGSPVEVEQVLISPRAKSKSRKNLNTIDTNSNTPIKYIFKKGENENHNNNKIKIEINEEILDVEDEKYFNNKRKNRNSQYKKKNNLVTESREILDDNNNNNHVKNRNKIQLTKLNLKNINKHNKSKKMNSDNNIENTNGENGEDKKEVKNANINRRRNTQFPLILINANNTVDHAPLSSNYCLNSDDYEQAINYEQRPFCRIFFIYLISKENILNIIFYNPPLELKPMRLCIFIFNFACDFALNALFYLSENISDKYHYTGAYRELYALANNLTISLVSTIVTFILLYFFESLTKSNSRIEKLFREQENLLKNDKTYKVNNETINEIKNKIEKIIKCLKIKIILFLIFEALFMLFFFYYVTAFCQVYQNTQVSWLLDCISSYAISLIITLAISYLAAVFYKLSIQYKIKILYKISVLVY